MFAKPKCVRSSDSSRLIRGISSHAKAEFYDVIADREYGKEIHFRFKVTEKAEFAILIELPIVRASAFT